MRTRRLHACALAAVLGFFASPAFPQDEALGTVGDWTIRCSAVGTPDANCFLSQRAQSSDGRGIEAVALSAGDGQSLMAVRVPGSPSLATPLRADAGGISREFTWQSCDAGSCEALLPLDAATVAAIEDGTTLSFMQATGGDATTVALPGRDLGLGLSILDEIAAGGAEALAALATPATAQPQQVRYISVLDVRFTPSEYLTTGELDAAAAPYIGRRVTVADLGGLLDAVNRLYAQRGASLAEAFLVSIDGGIVDIELFEAHIGSVGYVAQNASDAYLAFRLGLEPGMLADTRLIEERLQRLALTDGAIAAASFLPGADRGLTDLTLTFEEPAPYWWYVGVDNYGAAATGMARMTIGGGLRSLTGWNDPLSVDVVVTQGSVAGVLTYSRVIHPSGTTLTGALDASASRTMTLPNVTDRAVTGTISLTHPVILEPNARWNVGGAVLAFGEDGTIAGVPLVSQRGSGVRVTSTGSWTGTALSLVATQALTVVQWDNLVTATSDGWFVGLGGSASAVLSLGPALAFSIEAAGQLALSGAAPARFQFGASGPLATRGYGSELSKGDSGFFVRTELGAAAPIVIDDGFALRPYAFADFGRAFEVTGPSQGLLASIGVGSGIVIVERMSGDIFVAKPLLDANGFSAADAYEIRVALTAAF
jgi:hemolysin activation/secretion protein/invasion protein IalB